MNHDLYLRHRSSTANLWWILSNCTMLSEHSECSYIGSTVAQYNPKTDIVCTLLHQPMMSRVHCIPVAVSPYLPENLWGHKLHAPLYSWFAKNCSFFCHSKCLRQVPTVFPSIANARHQIKIHLCWCSMIENLTFVSRCGIVCIPVIDSTVSLLNEHAQELQVPHTGSSMSRVLLSCECAYVQIGGSVVVAAKDY